MGKYVSFTILCLSMLMACNEKKEVYGYEEEVEEEVECEEEQGIIVQKDERGNIVSVEFSIEDSTIRIPESAETFFTDILKIQADDHFEMISQKTDKEGFVHEHFDQYYKGVKVDGAGYVFHYRNGKMYLAHGHYVKINKLSVAPSITENEAKLSFVHYKDIPLDIVTGYDAELLVKEIPVKDEMSIQLVYKVLLNADYANNTEYGYVDAQTGKVVWTESFMIDFANSPQSLRYACFTGGYSYSTPFGVVGDGGRTLIRNS